ncbi:MAG: beta-eliminating lyase-related protein [Chlamydiota bacterium]
MNRSHIYLASDNWAPAHPAILQSVIEANNGYSEPYGSDKWTAEAERQIQRAFDVDCKVFIVPTGTGANVFALRLAIARHESIICSDIAHIQYQESGAAEALIGCKLLTVPHEKGKISREAVMDRLQSEKAFGKHGTFPRVLSITQPTEIGTIYTLNELRSLAQLCQEEHLLLHIDGCRIYNAAISLQVSLQKMIHAAHPDLVCIGGTKNGCLAAEAVLVLNPNLYHGSDHLHKQTLQLFSKTRYISAQYISFFEKGLWKDCATQANQRAKELGLLIEANPQLSLSYPVETNQVFFTAPESWISRIQEKIVCYIWNQKKREIRWITSWNTLIQDVEKVGSILNPNCA